VTIAGGAPAGRRACYVPVRIFAYPELLVVPLVIIMAVLSGCRGASAPGTPLDAAQAGAVKEEVRRMASDIARDLAQGGPGAWLRYFDDSEAFFMASDGELKFESFASAESYLGDFASGVESMAIAWEDLRIDPVSAEMAVMAASYQELINETSGSQLAFGGYLTALAVKTPSGWRLRHLHWSSEPPAAGE